MMRLTGMIKTAPRSAYLLLFLPPLFWAGNVVLARGVIDIIPPVAMSFWRWLIALCLLLPFSWRQTLHDLPVIRSGWKIICLLSFFGIASFNTLLYTAAHTTSSINLALTQSVMPAVIVLISYFLFREKIFPRQMFAVFLCFSGAVYIVMRGDWQRLLSMRFVQGDLLMLLAVVFYALYAVLLRKSPKLHQFSFLTATFSLGLCFLLPLYLWESWLNPTPEISWQMLASLLYVGIFPSIFAYFFWNRGVEAVGANRAGLYINLIPIFASLMAIVFLGEVFKVYHLIGLVLIAGGLALFNLPRSNRQDGQKKGEE